MEFVIITGMSGSGKSRAIAAMEDIGYYCVDNLPPKMVKSFTDLCLQAEDKVDKSRSSSTRAAGKFSGTSSRESRSFWRRRAGFRPSSSTARTRRSSSGIRRPAAPTR